VTVTQGTDGELASVTTQLDQFAVNGFKIDDDATHVKDYAYRGVEKRREQIPVWLEEHRDWQGSISLFGRARQTTATKSMLTITTTTKNGKIAPRIGWKEPLSCWQTAVRKCLARAFSEFSLHERTISATEKRAYETWHHIALEGYDFTASANVFGHQYTVFNLYDDIWMGYSYTQWFDRNIDLIAEVDSLLEQGVPVDQITPEMIPNLNLYAKPAFTPSFRYHDNGDPRVWYLVTDDPFYDASGYVMQAITFTPGGLANAGQ